MPPVPSISVAGWQWRTCAGIFLVAAAVTSCIAAASSPPAHGIPVLLAGDSVLSCPAGRSYAVFAQFLQLGGGTASELFPGDRRAWIHDHGAQPRLPADLQRTLARRAGVPPDSIRGGPAFCAYFVTEFRRSLQDRVGSGVALHLAPDNTGLEVRGARTQDSSLVGPPGRWHLRPSQILVMRVDLEGQPYAMMLWAPTVPQEKRSELQREFLRGAQAVAFPGMADLQPRTLNKAVLDAIDGPRNRAAAAQP